MKAVDGTVLRGTARHDGKPLELLSAVTHPLRLTLDQNTPLVTPQHLEALTCLLPSTS